MCSEEWSWSRSRLLHTYYLRYGTYIVDVGSTDTTYPMPHRPTGNRPIPQVFIRRCRRFTQHDIYRSVYKLLLWLDGVRSTTDTYTQFLRGIHRNIHILINAFTLLQCEGVTGNKHNVTSSTQNPHQCPYGTILIVQQQLCIIIIFITWITSSVEI